MIYLYRGREVEVTGDQDEDAKLVVRYLENNETVAVRPHQLLTRAEYERRGSLTDEWSSGLTSDGAPLE